MEKLWRRLLIVGAFSGFACLPVTAQSSVYTVSRGDQQKTLTYETTQTATGRRVVQTETGDGQRVVQSFDVDGALATIAWSYEDPSTKTSVKAVRRDRIISLTGFHDGKELERQFKIQDWPWNQYFVPGLQGFALSGEGECHFWTIGTTGPGDMKIAEFMAIRQQIERIPLGSETIRSIRLRITFPGSMSVLWHADCWLREKDGLYLRYQAKEGPVAPLTTIQLNGVG